jgi:hypothetical protein
LGEFLHPTYDLRKAFSQVYHFSHDGYRPLALEALVLLLGDRVQQRLSIEQALPFLGWPILEFVIGFDNFLP